MGKASLDVRAKKTEQEVMDLKEIESEIMESVSYGNMSTKTAKDLMGLLKQEEKLEQLKMLIGQQSNAITLDGMITPVDIPTDEPESRTEEL